MHQDLKTFIIALIYEYSANGTIGYLNLVYLVLILVLVKLIIFSFNLLNFMFCYIMSE